MKIDIEAAKERLFERAKDKIAGDYQFEVPTNPQELAERVLRALDQQTCANPLVQHYDNRVIFKAAVRSLASNMRKWSTFLAHEPKITTLLKDYVIEDLSLSPPDVSVLRQALKGQTSTQDARSILAWLSLLSRQTDYYDEIIVKVSEEIGRRAKSLQFGLLPHELFLCVAAYLSNPPSDMREIKWPGMGFPLGSEFLRNLGWNGFKPDRHIKRLFHSWIGDRLDTDVAPITELVQRVIGRHDHLTAENVKYSLIGIKISPDGHSFSEVDNLVWLLGVYVEKKGHETGYNYLSS
jgi:hypothetical protein